jgi:hypothetical protein
MCINVTPQEFICQIVKFSKAVKLTEARYGVISPPATGDKDDEAYPAGAVRQCVLLSID